MAKSLLKLKAIELRKQKRSIKFIARDLSVSVSSVSLWCRDIHFSQDEKKDIFNAGYFAGTQARLNAIQARKEKLTREIHQIHQKSISEIKSLSKREILIAGTALYWGEGFKKDKLVGLASMSPGIVKFFIKWLKLFNISTNDLIFRVTINVHKKEQTKSILEFWSQELQVNLNQFSQTYYQNTIQKKEYTNSSGYHGVIRIKVRKSITLLRQIEGYIKGLEKNNY